MIDPITELLLTETPSDSTIQSKFKELVNAETEKCKKIRGVSNYKKCKSFATSYAVKKFLRKFGNVEDEVIERVQKELRKIKKRI
jgi:hypothetical protein